MKAMILAAGFGTRLKPVTENIPKALVMHKGKTLLHTQIEKLKALDVKEIIINTHHFSQQIEQYISDNDFNIPIRLIHEEEILGTGGAVLNAKEFLQNDDFFILLNVDIDSDMDIGKLILAHLSKKPIATLAVQKRETKRKLEFDKNMNLLSRQNERSNPNRLFAFNGLHVISSEFFNRDIPVKFSDIINLYEKLAVKDQVRGYEFKEVHFMDIGKIENLQN